MNAANTGRSRLALVGPIDESRRARPMSTREGPGASLSLDLLNAFALHSDRRTCPPLPKKAQGLLAYLAMHAARPIPRDQLATLLWADRGSQQARRSLRQCLMSLRSVLGPYAEALVADSGTIRLDLTGHIDLDVRNFEQFGKSRALADLEAAASLYRDEFLTGLQISSEPFAEWIAAERRRLASMQSDVLYRLASALAEAGVRERAVDTAQHLTVFDPLREDGHRLLIRLLAAAGRRSDALRQYALCVDTLRRELGVAAEPATAELAEKIRKGMLEVDGSVSSDSLAAKPCQPDPVHVPARGSGTPVSSVSDKTSIAVLPFANLSVDGGQDYFADGIAEDVSQALGHIPWLFVIASSSTLGYLGRPVDMRQIGAELGVRYLVRGSVRRDGNRLRIVVQLTDSSSGGYLWSGRFEGAIGDLFEIQDRFTTQIAAMIAPALHAVEIKRAQRTPTSSLNAYELYLRALPRFRTSLADNEESLRLLGQAVEIDPAYGAAYGLAARCYQFQKLFGWIAPSDPRFGEGIRLANLAIEVGKDDSEALWMAGLALAQLAGEVKHGRVLIDRSLALNPNSASAWVASCFVHAYLGNVEAAQGHFACAQRLNPLDSMHHVQNHAASTAHFLAGNWEAADDCAEKAVGERPTYPPSLRMKTVTCALLGRLDEAQAFLRRLLSVNPDATVCSIRGYVGPQWRYRPQAVESFMRGLRLAGLPEGGA